MLSLLPDISFKALENLACAKPLATAEALVALILSTFKNLYFLKVLENLACAKPLAIAEVLVQITQQPFSNRLSNLFPE